MSRKAAWDAIPSRNSLVMRGLVGVVLAVIGCMPAGTRPAAPVVAEGFSRADGLSDSVPIVTTRLYRLDANGFPARLPTTIEEARAETFVPANAWEELDDIYGLLALAVVHADWQESRDGQPDPRTRGHNIGGVIIDGGLEVVNWERNSNDAMCNGTQHGEVRTMLKHLNITGSGTLRRHQIYTSLEPCMMCSGMMMQQGVLRTVYMQTDNAFGKNIERLTIDTSTSPVRFDDEPTGQDGYGPAARPVISSMAKSEFRRELDFAWRNASRDQRLALTEWLKTDEAEDIYRRARAKFANYPLRFGDQRAIAKFIVPKGATNGKMDPAKFLVLQASKTNAELYEAALRFFNDPARGIIPYIRRGVAGTGTLVEAKDNVLATRLLEDPQGQARAEHRRGDSRPAKVPSTEVLLVDGTFDGAPVHQERIRRICPR